MAAKDDAGNESKISNKVTIYKSSSTTIRSTHIFVLIMSALTFTELLIYMNVN